MGTFEFIKQIVQYGGLTDNKHYAYTSPGIIIIKLKLCGLYLGQVVPIYK